MSTMKFIQCKHCKIYVKPDFILGKGAMSMTCPHCSGIIKYASLTELTEEELYLISQRELSDKKSKPLF